MRRFSPTKPSIGAGCRAGVEQKGEANSGLAFSFDLLGKSTPMQEHVAEQLVGPLNPTSRRATMTDIKDRVDQWLRDAHAMEEQAETMLTGQASRIENYPELKARIDQHLQETRYQRDRLEACIERRGATSSTLKDMTMKFTAMMQNLSGVFAGDEVVKGVMASYTFEHMEIASYRILIAAAEADGDSETARVCQEILAEEEAMAAWLEENMGAIATMHLVREDASLDEAKR